MLDRCLTINKGGAQLDERKLKILQAIVDKYILTGEPVGSKIIMNEIDITVSAATIRNEMSALEQMGFLEQPHTSAGRIPTFSGFRFYVDKIMCKNKLSEDEIFFIDEMLDFDDYSEDVIIEKASHALAEITKCATLSTNMNPKFSAITKVEVIPTGKRLYVLLMITSSGSIKNKVCRLEFDLSDEQLEFFTKFINENLEGINLDDVSEELMNEIALAMGTYMMTLTPLISGILKMSQDMLISEVKISGEQNLLACNDFEHNEIMQFINNKNEFTKLLDDSFSDLQVIFSNDKDASKNNTFAINNSSIITTPIKKGGNNIGSLGVIGPMRLDYAKIIPYIEYFSQKISEIFDENDNEI